VRTARRILQERGISDAGYASLRELARTASDTPTRLRGLWAAHVTRGLDDKLKLEFLADRDEYIRAWAIQLACEDRQVSQEVLSALERLAATDPSPVVRLYLAAAMQRLPNEQRWTTLARLMQHASDAEDANIPRMIWYALEPLVVERPAQALDLVPQTKIELLGRWIIRRAAADSKALDQVVQRLAAAGAPAQQLRILEEMLRAFEGRVDVPMPPSWQAAYEHVLQSGDAKVAELAEQIAVIFGDRRIFPQLRSRLADEQAPLEVRRRALAILVRGRDTAAAAALHAALSNAELRRDLLRALITLGNDETPTVLLSLYGKLAPEERSDAINVLASRPAFAHVLLDAVESGRVPRTDVHAYHVRQMLQLRDDRLAERIRQAWGEVRSTSEEKKKRIAHYKSQLTADVLAKANLGNGRRIFDSTCASCHTLFGTGGKVGPDITGSNRADLDYILENVIDPSAVLGKDYRMSVITTVDGRVLSGIVQDENDNALTLRTLNDSVVIAKAEIEDRVLSELSLMPDNLLDQMSPEEVRDLVAYLASPVQVPPRGPSAPIDPATSRVPGAQEGERLRVIRKTAGNVGPQDMRPFSKDRWSGNAQLWWTGAAPGAILELAISVAEEGEYVVELVMTRARDYGIVQLALDDVKLGEPIDLYNYPDVVTTGVLTFPARTLSAGEHRLRVEIVGRHPQAIPAHMFGLDYIRLTPKSDTSAAKASSSP
jgi:putative heme-binding domain-containing protein